VESLWVVSSPPVSMGYIYISLTYFSVGPIEEGPTQQELLELLQQCEISQSRSSSAMSSRVPSPSPSLLSLVYPNLKQLHNTGASNSSINHQMTPKQSLTALHTSLSSHSIDTVCDTASLTSTGLSRQASIRSHVLSIKRTDCSTEETMVNFEMKVENKPVKCENDSHVPLSRAQSDGSANKEKPPRRSASSSSRPVSRSSATSDSTPHTSRPGSSSGRSSDYFSIYQEEGLSFDC